MTTTPIPAERVSGTIKADLKARLSEIIIWRKTGILTGEALRTMAEHESYQIYGVDNLRRAEDDTLMEAARILAAIQPDPEPQPVIEDADMKRCAGCGSVRDRRGMDCLEDGSWRCCDCIKSKPVVDGLIAMNACLVQLDMLVAESGRGVEWGEEDAFRMGEWFEDADLANIEQAKAFVAGLSRATPSSAGTVVMHVDHDGVRCVMLSDDSYWVHGDDYAKLKDSAGMVSVEAAAGVLLAAQEAYFDGEGGSDALGSLDTAALRALAGEGDE